MFHAGDPREATNRHDPRAQGYNDSHNVVLGAFSGFYGLFSGKWAHVDEAVLSVSAPTPQIESVQSYDLRSAPYSPSWDLDPPARVDCQWTQPNPKLCNLTPI